METRCCDESIGSCFSPTSCLLSVQVAAGVFSLVALWLAEEHFPQCAYVFSLPCGSGCGTGEMEILGWGRHCGREARRP